MFGENLKKKIMFENFNDLEILINLSLNNEDLSNNILVGISKNFEK